MRPGCGWETKSVGPWDGFHLQVFPLGKWKSYAVFAIFFLQHEKNGVAGANAVAADEKLHPVDAAVVDEGAVE